MKILSEADVSSDNVRRIRQGASLNQSDFWNAVGVSQSIGSRYERNMPIQRPVRILVFLRFVVGLPIDATTAPGIEELQRLADLHRTAKSN